jgi:MYXO-CTERM domain-containing protein
MPLDVGDSDGGTDSGGTATSGGDDDGSGLDSDGVDGDTGKDDELTSGPSFPGARGRGGDAGCACTSSDPRAPLPAWALAVWLLGTARRRRRA